MSTPAYVHNTVPTQYIHAGAAQHLRDAQLILYPDFRHGAHFQYLGSFVTRARLFLGG